MPTTIKPLGQLCSIITGAPISRIKKVRKGDSSFQTKVLVPASMQNGEIVESELAIEEVANVKEDFFTRKGDVIVKASTPYGCVYIDDNQSGLLTTSFSLILRSRSDQKIDTCFLSLYLNSPYSMREMERMSSGMTIQLIKKKGLAEMLVPVPSLKEQKRLAGLYDQIRNIKNICRAVEEKSNIFIEGELTRVLF